MVNRTRSVVVAVGASALLVLTFHAWRSRGSSLEPVEEDLRGPTVDFGLVRSGPTYARSVQLSATGARLDVSAGVTTSCGCVQGTLEPDTESPDQRAMVRLVLVTTEQGGRIAEEWWARTADGRKIKGYVHAQVARSPILDPPAVIVDDVALGDHRFERTCHLFVPPELGSASVTLESSNEHLNYEVHYRESNSPESATWIITITGVTADVERMTVTGATVHILTSVAAYAIPLRLYIGHQGLSSALPREILLVRGSNRYTVPLPENDILGSTAPLTVFAVGTSPCDIWLDERNRLHIQALAASFPAEPLDLLFAQGADQVSGRVHFLSEPE